MIDSFPFDQWDEEIREFWTFGPGGSFGTYVLTVLGIVVMVAALAGWVILEQRKLREQTSLLQSASGLGAVPTQSEPGEGPSQPPLGGPSTEPGA